MKNKEKISKKFIINSILFIIALAVFLFSAIKLIGIAWDYYSADKEYKDLEDYVAITETDETAETEEAAKNTFTVDFTKLKEINSDCVGWIRYETIDISYPIVQGTDNDYYLNHTFSGEEKRSACIFVDYMNASDFSDKNTFIYGHKMKDKSMFGQLIGYTEESFYREHPGFYIYTPEGVSYYTIFSCYEANIKMQQDSFQYKFSSEEAYQEYMDLVKKRSAYDTGIEADAGKKMITLMTCANTSYDYRLLMHAMETEVLQ